MYRLYYNLKLTILFVVALSFGGISQNKAVFLLDAETEEPVMFAYVISGSFNLLSDSKGVVWIPLDSKDSFQISHINYINRTVGHETFHSVDTVFLQPQSFILSGVEVIGSRKEIDLYGLINSVLRKYQKSSQQELRRFTYLLRTIKDSEIVEQINADISVNYSIGNGARLPQKWLNRGDFEFNHNAPFINLDIEKLIFQLHPFTPGRDYNLLSTQRIRKRRHDVGWMDCKECEENQIKVSISSPSQTCILLIDTSRLEVRSATYLINSYADLTFFQLLNDSEYDFNEIVLTYKFDELGFPELIEGIFELGSDSYSLNVKTLIFPIPEADSSFRFHVWPRYPFENIYEQIAFQPIPKLEESVQNRFIVDSTALSSFNEGIREVLIESSITPYQLIYLNKLVDSIPLKFFAVEEEFYMDRFGRPKNRDYVSDLRVHQSYGFEKRGDEARLLSISPILDLSTSKIYSQYEDPYFNHWALMLVTYLYEVDRQRLVREFNVKWDVVDSSLFVIRTEFIRSAERYNELLKSLLIEPDGLFRMVELNDLIYSKIGYDVFEKLIAQDFNCEECRESLINDIVKLGYRIKRGEGDAEEGSLCLKLGLIGLKTLKNNFEDKEFDDKDNRLLASYYSRMGGIYIELDNVEDACSSFESSKLLWPKAFNLSPKR